MGRDRLYSTKSVAHCIQHKEYRLCRSGQDNQPRVWGGGEGGGVVCSSSRSSRAPCRCKAQSAAALTQGEVGSVTLQSGEHCLAQVHPLVSPDHQHHWRAAAGGPGCPVSQERQAVCNAALGNMQGCCSSCSCG